MGSSSSNQITVTVQAYTKCVAVNDYIDNFGNQYSRQTKPQQQSNEIKSPHQSESIKQTKKQQEPKKQIQQQQNQTKQNLKLADWIWPNGIIPYIIDESFTFQMRQTLQLVISEFQEKTPIRFVEISDDQQYDQYVKYYRNEKYSSYVRWIGRQLTQKEHAIFINDQYPYGTYLHETMHVLGFEHEQCRQDRDNYVSVQFQEKDSKKLKHQYEKKGFMIGEYDPDSIMHYSLNRNMTSKGQFNNQQFGQRKQLSEGDIKGIQLVYGKSQCTYDTYGDKYMEQDFFECITCWGQDSVFGACRACGITCHQGHELILKKSKSFYCDCGKYNHKNNLCTRQTTKFKRVQQSMYLCYDCFDIQKYQQNHDGAIPGVCYSCAKKCHKQHKVKFYQVAKGFFCDCGLKDCKTKCIAK